MRVIARVSIAAWILAACLGAGTPARSSAPSPLGAPLPPPLAPPIVLNGGFGDYRGGHFHAGFDFGTGGRVGKPVRAPANGWVERVRASGVGYGRSLYVRIDDGRTLQFGHLDAFAGPVAAYVRAAQDSTGQYEQDLWPEAGRFKIRAGSVIAWTGESGAGGPHLHFEIRRGDMAYHPLRAGLKVADTRTPTIPRITLEPLDDRSSVDGYPGPVTFDLGRRDTIRASGRLRVVADARDGVWAGVDRTVPWSVGIEWNGHRTECRFDSVSWATDMKDGVYVHDAGRVTGEKGLVLWAPRGFRPRVLVTDAPIHEDAGTIVITPADPPRVLLVWARDVGGREVRREIVLRPGPAMPSPMDGWHSGGTPWRDVVGTFASLPEGHLRWTVTSNISGGMDFQLSELAKVGTRRGKSASAVLPLVLVPADRATPLPLAVRGLAAPRGGEGGLVTFARLSGTDSCVLAETSGRASVRIPAGATFETAAVIAFPGSAARATGLETVGESWSVEPGSLPLRLSARVTFRVPERETLDRLGLYRQSGSDWGYVGAAMDTIARTVSGETKDLGRFALFRDATPPTASVVKPAAPKMGGPYSRWAVEANVADGGSGIDPRASYLEIDGVRVPSEWDPEVGRLRWRPARPPKSGTHRVAVIVVDRAGNLTREAGTFRMGS